MVGEKEGKWGRGRFADVRYSKVPGSEGEEAKKRRHWSWEGRKQRKPWPGRGGREEQHLGEAGRNLCNQRQHSSEL